MKEKLQLKIDLFQKAFDKKTRKETLDMLLSKGVANGCFQNYQCLVALIDIAGAITEG